MNSRQYLLLVGSLFLGSALAVGILDTIYGEPFRSIIRIYLYLAFGIGFIFFLGTVAYAFWQLWKLAADDPLFIFREDDRGVIYESVGYARVSTQDQTNDT